MQSWIYFTLQFAFYKEWTNLRETNGQTYAVTNMPLRGWSSRNVPSVRHQSSEYKYFVITLISFVPLPRSWVVVVVLSIRHWLVAHEDCTSMDEHDHECAEGS